MSLCFAYASENFRFIFIPPGKRGTFWKGKILSFKEDLVRNANIIFLFGCTVGEITNIWDTHQAIILNFLKNTASSCQGICLEIVEISYWVMQAKLSATKAKGKQIQKDNVKTSKNMISKHFNSQNESLPELIIKISFVTGIC